MPVPTISRTLLAAIILVSGALSPRSDAEETEVPPQGSAVKLAWDLSEEPDIAGYRVHYGPESGLYTETIDVGFMVNAELTGLATGAVYFSAVTAYNSSGLESPFSNEISFTVQSSLQYSDEDHDGLSDYFEAIYSGDEGLHPDSDLDGDGLNALAEFVHGLDPTQAQGWPREPIGTIEIDGERYLCVHYFVDPLALQFATIHSERSTDISHEELWASGHTVQVSSSPSEKYPGLLRIVERSLSPLSAQRHEFLRLAYEVIDTQISP
jgi:hypothetical protein